MSIAIHIGDSRSVLSTLPDASVQTCVTSPPYFGLRDYGVDGQIGLEGTVDAYVQELVTVFREVRRVLADDGTLWLNLGDSYAGPKGNTAMTGGKSDPSRGERMGFGTIKNIVPDGLKPKDLIGIPWRVAFALQSDGWYLRQDIIWSKANPMPESVKDRCTKSHEYIFLLTKRPRYFYDAAAIAETSNYPPGGSHTDQLQGAFNDKGEIPGSGQRAFRAIRETRNKRSVWTVSTQPFSEAHFATFPPKLIEPCILAGSKKGDTVLDPFGGAATTGLVADMLERNAILIELNPEYANMGADRIRNDSPMFANVAVIA